MSTNRDVYVYMCKIIQYMRSLNVVFYQPKDDDHWLNKVVSTFSPPYCHCDILFDDSIATSIYQKETVYQEKKSLSREGYTWVSLTFTDEELDRIRKFCDKCFHDKVEFDELGMYLSFLPYNPMQSETKTFCSKFIWEALQKSERSEFTSSRAGTMTPSRIYRALKKMDKSFLNISVKRLEKLNTL